MFSRLTFGFLLAALCPLPAVLGQDYSAELPRIPPTEPAAAVATIQVKPGFRIDQVAAEPLVNSPVAMAWDENSRLFVVEMRGYSENRDDAISRISMLTDRDRDGRYDTSSVYVDKLLWPTAVACYEGGIFVADAPDIWYFKDTDGDGRADVRRKLFTGFGVHNVQGLLNSFTWTLDNRIEAAGSSVGGDIFLLDEQGNVPKDARPVSVRGRDIAFNPRTLEFGVTSGGLQHGMSFDDWGRKFVSGNSNHIQQVMYEDRYLARAPYIIAPPARIDIAEDGGQAEVFRISPVESWRIVRTRLRVSGAVKGVVEGGGRAAGYFTGATGVTIYRGTALGDDMYGMAVVGDVGSNLVHRKRLILEGVQFLARRVDMQSEFIASKDTWFRPAQFASGPDGALYIADVYREVIEHPASIPPEIKQHLDLTSGRDRGRVYRVVADEFQQPSLPKLGEATTLELVALLEHPNAWHRSTASRLLFEQHDPAAIPLLAKLAAEGANPVGRMHAMYALDGLGALDEAIILKGLNDQHPRVREHAIRLSERLGTWPEAIRARLYALADDDDMPLRYQLAYTLGLVPTEPQREAALVKIARHDGADRWVRTAVLVSLSASGSDAALNDLLADASFRRSEAGHDVIVGLASAAGLRGQPLTKAINSLDQDDEALVIAVVRGYAEALSRSGRARSVLDENGTKFSTILQKLLATARTTAGDEKKSIKARVQAINALPLGSFAGARDLLVRLLDQRQPDKVQQAVLAALEKFRDPGVAPLLIDAWPALGPRTRVAAAEALLARPERITALLDAIEQGRFSARDIELPRLQLLLNNKDDAIRRRAVAVLGTLQTGRRLDVVDGYRGALKLSGDAAHGKQIFQKICAACHKAEGVGHELGPNLATIKNRGPETILLNVLDPSREVNPQYVNYVLVTDDGRTITGMIANETATSVTLRRAESATDTVLRVNIEQLQSTGLSLMPEGLEKQIDPQGLADVIAYLMALK
ncbi:MAG TPA: PVC-type heme-binding CxxCH protein [Pirellulales bacterium]|jgi:putative membrane-bound dehydrogenase-like protein|nr:PVC-type heme-binding CxxCH protein [Pirellulales bacterium]